MVHSTQILANLSLYIHQKQQHLIWHSNCHCIIHLHCTIDFLLYWVGLWKFLFQRSGVVNGNMNRCIDLVSLLKSQNKTDCLNLPNWLLNIWTTREMLLRLKIKWKRHCIETRRGMYNCRFQWNKLTMQIQGKREAFQSIFKVPKQRRRHVLRQH